MKPEILKSKSTRQLIELFVLSGKMIDAGTDPEMYTVRGWLMDELEARNPEAMEAYLESDCWDDEDLYKFFPC